jgi:cytochrome c peroxidase
MNKGLYGLVIFIVFLSFTGVASALTPEENLGQSVYQDTAFSLRGNQSCQTCHHPSAGFADPVNRRNLVPVSEGSIPGLFGGRNAPPAAYAAFSPIFDGNCNATGADCFFSGGLFWDGRATGRMDISGTAGPGDTPTGDPLADQAKGPFLNPVEMALVDKAAFLTIFKANQKYVKFYNQIYPSISTASDNDAYNNIARAIAAFESSTTVNKFKSKFDAFRAEQALESVDVSTIMIDTSKGITSAVYSVNEIDGLALFNTPRDLGGGGCSQCHPVPSTGATQAESVFTDFSYENMGIPVNQLAKDLNGSDDTDYGLGTQVTILETVAGTVLPKLEDADNDQTVVASEAGKFKVPSLRNIAKTAPYGHNGYFLTLFDIVHFYNTREVSDWAPPEVIHNVNDQDIGNLGLNDSQEQLIVTFLETLTD